jgi:rubrerythrin
MNKPVVGGGVTRAKLVLGAILGIVFVGHVGVSSGQGFDQQDRERLVRLEATLLAFVQQTDKRFAELRDDMNKRLQQLDKRIDDLRQEMKSRLEEMRADVNKRFEEMRADSNKRFEEMREDTNKRFEQVDKRFEQIDKRIDQLITFLWILAGIFTALVVAVIAFAYWGRRTIIRRAKEEALKEMEEAGRWKTILKALRQIAIKDSNVAEALRRFNLL